MLEEFPPFDVNLTMRQGLIEDVAFPKDPSILVCVYEYNTDYPKERLEQDESGVLCKRTNWKNKSGLEQVTIKVYSKAGKIYRVVIPFGVTVIVKTYRASSNQPSVQRYTRKKSEK